MAAYGEEEGLKSWPPFCAGEEKKRNDDVFLLLGYQG